MDEKEKQIPDDEFLLHLYREGDEGGAELLMERYKDMVRKKARTMYLAGGDTDDLIQEGMIGLFKAMRDYQEEKGVPFGAFAMLCVERQLIKAVQRSNRKKNLPLSDYVSLDDQTEKFQAPIASDPEEIVLSEEARQSLEELIETRLSVMERDVLSRYVEGESYARIAQQLGMSTKTVDNAVQRIRRKIRTF